MKQKTVWYDFMWIWTIVYFILGYFNILFAWLGLIDFTIPLVVALTRGDKWFCNNFCGRGKLYNLLGASLKMSSGKKAPGFISSRAFRYLFLTFFMTMFGVMIFNTVLVAKDAASLHAFVKLFWTFNVPWDFAYVETGLPAWVYQFGYGFYSMMLTSTIIGMVLMFFFRPRTWCSFCPMGCMTQGICRIKHGK